MNSWSRSRLSDGAEQAQSLHLARLSCPFHGRSSVHYRGLGYSITKTLIWRALYPTSTRGVYSGSMQHALVRRYHDRQGRRPNLGRFGL
jgi:hypothetical protein